MFTESELIMDKILRAILVIVGILSLILAAGFCLAPSLLPPLHLSSGLVFLESWA
jgi:hypothetical protein